MAGKRCLIVAFRNCALLIHRARWNRLKCEQFLLKDPTAIHVSVLLITQSLIRQDSLDVHAAAVVVDSYYELELVRQPFGWNSQQCDTDSLWKKSIDIVAVVSDWNFLDDMRELWAVSGNDEDRKTGYK